MKKFFFVLSTVWLLVFPVLVFAATPEESCKQLNEQVNNFSGEQVGSALEQHCIGPGVGIGRLVTLGLGIAASVAAIFIVIGGYRYVTSSGNVDAASKAKKTIMWAAIGLVLIIMAGAIIRIVANFVTGK